MLPIKINDPPESLVDETAISNEISWKKGCATGFVLHINAGYRVKYDGFSAQH